MLSKCFVFCFMVVSLTDAFPQGLPTLDPGISRIAGKFVIDCRRPTAAYFPDPEDCRNFYHCSDWTGLQKKSCGNNLYFNPQTEVCDWPNHVRAIRPECPNISDIEPQSKPPKAFQSLEDVSHTEVAALRFVPLSTNPIRFPDPTPSEPLSQFTLEHAIPGRIRDQSLFNPAAIREEVRNINGDRTRGRVITPLPIKATPLPPLNEIDELHAPRAKGTRGRKPARQPIPDPAIINTVQNDFIFTTPFPQVKNSIPQQQVPREHLQRHRPFNLHHPFQTSFDQFRIDPNIIQPNVLSSQRPRQPATTSTLPPPPKTTPSTTRRTTQTPETTTTTLEAQTTFPEEIRKQRVRLLNKTRRTTTPAPQIDSVPAEVETKTPERPFRPSTRSKTRGRLIATHRVRRPIGQNSNRSRRPQIISTKPQQVDDIVNENDEQELETVVDRRPVPLPKARATIRPIQRVVQNKETEELPEDVRSTVSNFRLKQRQKVKSDTAFLICSEGKCSRPKAGQVFQTETVKDLRTAASARLPSDTNFNRLFEEMLVNSGIDSKDDEQQGQVLSLLEAAKVKFEEDPETEVLVLDELLETTVNPVEVTTTDFEEETTTTRGVFNNSKRRPFFRSKANQRQRLKSKSKKVSKQEELEEELKFEEKLVEAAETILEESENVDQQMLDEMIEIKENIKKIKEQIAALKNTKKNVRIKLKTSTESSLSADEENDEITSTENEIMTTTDKLMITSTELYDTTISATDDSIDSTTTDANQDVETTTSGLKVFKAIPITTLATNLDEEEEQVLEVESFLHDFEPIFDDGASDFGEESVFVVNPVQVNENDDVSTKTKSLISQLKALAENEIVGEEQPRSGAEVTTISEKDLPLLDDNTSASSVITESPKQITESQTENEADTTVSTVTFSEFTSSRSVEATSPSSYDLLVNLMDHFNLNAIITSLQEDTLDKQIKPIVKVDDDSEELLQESVVISSVPRVETTNIIQTTDKTQSITEKVQTTTQQQVETTREPLDFSDLNSQSNGARIIIPSIPEETTLENNGNVKSQEEMVHIVMPAGWSTTPANDDLITTEEVSRSTTTVPAIQQASTINPIIVDITTQPKETIMTDGFIIATNKPKVRLRLPTKKSTVVEKKVRLQNLRPSTITRAPTTTTTTAAPTTTTTTPAPTTTTIKETTIPSFSEIDTTTQSAVIVIATEVTSSHSVEEQDTTTLKSVEEQNPTTVTIVEAPRSSSGRGETPVVIDIVEEINETNKNPVVIVASSSEDDDAESTTKLVESVKEEEIAELGTIIASSFKPTPATKKIRKLKKGRFSNNRDRIRKRLRQNIKGQSTGIDALSFVRNRQQLEKKKASKNSFLLKGKGNKDEKEKKIDVKKLQSRRKELFRKRIKPRIRPGKLTSSSSTRSPLPTSTTTNIDSLRTTSRFNPPSRISSNPLSRLPPTGSRARGVLGRQKPQAARGLFVARRPSTLPNKSINTNPTSSVSSKLSSSTTSISELQKLQRELQQQQEQLRQIQGSPNQKDEGGGRKDFLKQKEPFKEPQIKSETPNIRCRFFKNSC